MDTLRLSDIKQGLPGISRIEGANLYENCIVALHNCGHSSPVTLHVEGLNKTEYSILWEESFNETLERTYKDEQSLIERAAVCLGVSIALKQTPFTVIERSRKGTGFDYMLGDKDDIFFMPKARLEISGINKESTKNRLSTRYRAKAKQTQKSRQTMLPAYVSVIEFATPKAIFDLTR